jgi:DNA mismatch endonuclease (patch repair protein)
VVDKVDKTTRSRMMASVKSKNTAPELNIRKALFARGLRYRLHNKNLPGSPDLVFPKHKAVIFIHGCFWHNHDCKHGKMPATNQEFWERKIQTNVERDLKNIKALKLIGWRIKVIWSCSLKNKKELRSESGIREIINWLKNRQ